MKTVGNATQARHCHTWNEPKDKIMEFLSSNPLLAKGSLHSLRQAVELFSPEEKGSD